MAWTHANLYMYWYSTRVRLPQTNGGVTAAVSGDDHGGGVPCSDMARLGELQKSRLVSSMQAWPDSREAPTDDGKVMAETTREFAARRGRCWLVR